MKRLFVQAYTLFFVVSEEEAEEVYRVSNQAFRWRVIDKFVGGARPHWTEKMI